MSAPLRYVASLFVAVLMIMLSAPAASALDPDDPKIPVPGPLPDVPLPDLLLLPSVPEVPGISDCKEAPVPASPDQGVAGFFTSAPEPLPPAGDPFVPGAKTTIYEQYGYAGLRWRTYDLGCGPDAMRNPDAVIGTSVGNWIMQLPIALSAMTGSVTEVAFAPSFLDTFNPVIEQVSSALHDSLFATWIPAVLAALGLLIIFKSRRSALSTTAAAIGWALIVVILAVGLFRWPIAAGNAADATVTGTLGAVVGRLDGDPNGVEPGMAVSSHVHESILYRTWLAGTLGSPDSETAEKYGPALFKAQALTWREAAEAQKDPKRAKEIIEAKQKQWDAVAEKIKAEDPEAYENLAGKRSETRVGYSFLSALATVLSLPFLLLSALLMLGCYLIVRLAVMMFPAFAVLGAFPSTRGLVTGLGRTVAAAVVNAIIFGIGAGVTIAVLGILFNPGGGAPAWLSLVLMPLFSFIMWVALKPFRRLTTMVNPDSDHFGMSDSYARAKSHGKGWARQLMVAGASAATGGAAGAAAGTVAANALDDKDAPTDRAEARPSRVPVCEPLALESTSAREPAASTAAPDPTSPAPGDGTTTPYEARHASHRRPIRPSAAEPQRLGLPEGFHPKPTSASVPPAPIEPEWYDGDEVYPIFRPTPAAAEDAGDAA